MQIVPGARLQGKVERHEGYGVFVYLAPGRTGLMPLGETGLSSETYEAAGAREMREELGISAPLRKLYDYEWRTDFESENVQSFCAVFDGPIQTDPSEIEEGRFWEMMEIEQALGSGVFTPNFEFEFARYRSC